MQTNPVIDNVLEARGIVKTFPGVRALDGVDFGLRRGEVHALVGENGAGKSTLMHVFGGVLRPDAGRIVLAGQEIRPTNPHSAAMSGIAVVFQELSLVPNLSVAENIFANRQPVLPGGFIDFARLHRQTRETLSLFELNINPKKLVRTLSIAEQQVVEILKAVALEPKVLILDEPTSSLTAAETRHLFSNIRRLKESGISIIYISHHLPEIFEVCDRVSVMRDGKHVNTLNLCETNEAQIVKLMVGRELVNMYGSRESPVGEEYFHVEDASRGGDFRNVSITLRRGEILGIAGLIGAGRTELGRGIVGAEPLASGRILLEGEPVRIRSPRHAIRNGIGYLSEDRKQHGLFLSMPIRDNCVAPSLGSFTRGGFMQEQRIDAFAEDSRGRFNIAAPGIRQRVRNLSGGNQQKVLLSMWTGIRPRVLIIDEPTRGVDVGAKSEIYTLLRNLAAEGVGIIMISSDLLEILGLSDRILVMRHGSIAGEFSGASATEEQIMACAAGVGMN